MGKRLDIVAVILIWSVVVLTGTAITDNEYVAMTAEFTINLDAVQIQELLVSLG